MIPWRSIDENAPPDWRSILEPADAPAAPAPIRIPWIRLGPGLILAAGIVVGFLVARGPERPPEPTPATAAQAPAPPPPQPPLPPRPAVVLVPTEPAPAPAPFPAAPEPVPPPPPPPSFEARAWHEAWERAMARATGRDYDGAATELGRAARTFEEEAVRREAQADLEGLRAVAALYEEARAALAATPRGSRISLSRRDEAVEGLVCAADRQRVELLVKGAADTVFVEIAEASAASLLALRPKPPEPRTAGLFLLLDGDAAGAAEPDTVPPKYRAYKPAPAPQAGRDEAIARELYYAAEREFRSPRTRGRSSERYRTLLSVCAETALVRGSQGRIVLRVGQSREFYFGADDIRGGGSFTAADRPVVGRCWIAATDSSFGQAPQNFVEIEFHAEADTPYRAWALLGACCVERTLCYQQASHFEAPHPKQKGLMVGLEPGSIYGLPVRPPAEVDLKATHAEHARNAAVSWGWAEIRIPKYAAAGKKRVRILTDREGLAVARALVSSDRATPPRAGDLKALDGAREELLLPAAR